MPGNCINLFTVNSSVLCVKCGNIGAVMHYGDWYEKGLGASALKIESLKRYKDLPYMANMVGRAGVIPHKCINCGSIGLIDKGPVSGYKVAFISMKKEK